jgi:hypothetical protein
MSKPQADEIEWDDDDDAAADAAWLDVDRELRKLEAAGKAPADDDGMPDGMKSISDVAGEGEKE